MPLGDNLFAAKLKNMQSGSGCYKKKGEKSWKIWYDKKSTLSNFVFIERGYFDQKLPGESDRNGPDALKQFLT